MAGLGSHTPTSGLAAVARNIAAWCARMAVPGVWGHWDQGGRFQLRGPRPRARHHRRNRCSECRSDSLDGLSEGHAGLEVTIELNHFPAASIRFGLRPVMAARGCSCSNEVEHATAVRRSQPAASVTLIGLACWQSPQPLSTRNRESASQPGQPMSRHTRRAGVRNGRLLCRLVARG